MKFSTIWNFGPVSYRRANTFKIHDKANLFLSDFVKETLK